MERQRDHNFTTSSLTSRADIKAFCKDMIEYLRTEAGICEPVKVHFWAIPRGKNAYVIARKIFKKSGFSVFVNLSRFTCHTPDLRRLFLAAMLKHEMTHIQLFKSTAKFATYNHQLIMALAEGMNNREAHFLFRFLSRAYKGGMSFNKKVRDVSAEELYCMEQGLEFAFGLFKEHLNEEDLAKVSALYNTVRTMANSMEVTYLYDSTPYHRLSRTIFISQRLIFKKPALLQKYPGLQLVFENNGTLHSAVDFYKAARENNVEAADYFLLKLFVEDHAEIIRLIQSDLQAFSYISELANNYCQLCVNYVQSMSELKDIFFPKVVDDNAAMMIKITSKLHRQMKKYGIKHNGGSVIPLYTIY